MQLLILFLKTWKEEIKESNFLVLEKRTVKLLSFTTGIDYNLILSFTNQTSTIKHRSLGLWDEGEKHDDRGSGFC